MHILENKDLIVESKKAGAELVRIYSKKYNKEILWNGDEKFWARRSPVLFPIVGKLKENKTLIEDKIFSMNQHGFARDMNFELINTTDNSITYKLTSSEETKEVYPYDFNLFIIYTINNEKINVKWKIENIDNKEIYFSIGAHPAFNISSSKNLKDYYLEFECRDNVEKIRLENSYYTRPKKIEDLYILNLKSKIFENDALIYTNIDSISLKSKKEENYIKVSFKDFPLVGIWTPYYKETNTTAPFLCIEPWYGIADNIDSDKIYQNKKYINKLNVGETFVASYDIEII